MLSDKDLKQITEKGIDIDEFNSQLEKFKSGSPYLKITAPATLNHGIMSLTDNKLEKYVSLYEKEIDNLKILKFVPASGAASRMFKKLFEFLSKYQGTEEEYLELLTDRSHDSIYYFFENLDRFAFFPELRRYFFDNDMDLLELMEKNEYSVILEALLSDKALNYGNMPKGLIKFHKYVDFSRTAIEEHMVEAIDYCHTSRNKIPIHFTISLEHKDLFIEHFDNIQRIHEEKNDVKYDITFSHQSSSTDTIAVDKNNQPMRNIDGSLLFRPGGHGSLINNLNSISADLIFIKNIDNIVPDRIKSNLTQYNKALGGALLTIKKNIFKYLNLLEDPDNLDDKKLSSIIHFVEKDLSTILTDDFYENSKKEQISFLTKKLNRPIRVCGMVVNEGEPGGGPFFAQNTDGTESLQIVESHQINLNDESQAEIVRKSTHFNPVDMVCCTTNYKGRKFNLKQFVDTNAYFISVKSKDGVELKALELPGLWNGAMSDWNTIFIEIPVETFNPVKVINDLLKEEHQSYD